MLPTLKNTIKKLLDKSHILGDNCYCASIHITPDSIRKSLGDPLLDDYTCNHIIEQLATNTSNRKVIVDQIDNQIQQLYEKFPK
jgi:uncharacterized protein (DUF608 family)